MLVAERRIVPAGLKPAARRQHIQIFAATDAYLEHHSVKILLGVVTITKGEGSAVGRHRQQR
jgi:hypothetical protein